MFKKDRAGRQGGGVLLYIRDYLQPVICNIDSPYEIVGATISGLTCGLSFYLVYRPPHQSVDSDDGLYALLSRLIERKNSIIAGDFNCIVDWDTWTAGAEGSRLLDFANDNFLTQVVNEPTRGNNILDLIFSTEDNMLSHVSVEERLATSDHSVVKCKLNLLVEAEAHSYRNVLNFRRANFRRFREELARLPLPQPTDIDPMWTTFKAQFLEIQSTCIPSKRIGGSTTESPRWFTAAIGREIAERKRLYKIDKAHSTGDTFAALTAQRRYVDRLKRNAERAEELRVAGASKHNPKEFFKHVNSRKPVQSSIGPLRSDQGQLITSDVDMAEELNGFFTSVFTDEVDGELPDATLTYIGDNPLEEIVCTAHDIEGKVKKLKACKAAGPDSYLPRVLKEVSEQLVPHLLVIFNRSLEVAAVPNDMKLANVTPIFKKGDTGEPGNYRPISLTSVVGKLLESIIADRIVDFLEENDLLRNSQHGFRRKRSCLTNLLEFFHKMLSIFDSSRAIDIIYLDFKKAFDKVPHKRLLVKVRALGIGGNIAGWIEHWLSERKQRVVINGRHSGWSPVASGVPQGSVLGPLLFLIYINDLDTDLISTISKFADDTKMGINAADPDQVISLQRDLHKIGEWSQTWQMPFNTDKCKAMHIGYANPEAEYTLQGHRISPTNLERDLGVLISKDLKFSSQCIQVEKRANKLLGYIKRQFRYKNKEIVLTLYNALVRPILEYAVQFWAPTLVKDVERLERVQARATKMIPEVRGMGYQRRCANLNLITLAKRRLRGQLIETFKILKGFENVDPGNYFTLSNNRTRGHSLKVDPPRFNTRPCGDFMTYRICNVWNRLPERVVASQTVETFKRRLDRILQDIDY